MIRLDEAFERPPWLDPDEEEEDESLEAYVIASQLYADQSGRAYRPVRFRE